MPSASRWSRTRQELTLAHRPGADIQVPNPLKPYVALRGVAAAAKRFAGPVGIRRTVRAGLGRKLQILPAPNWARLSYRGKEAIEQFAGYKKVVVSWLELSFRLPIGGRNS